MSRATNDLALYALFLCASVLWSGAEPVQFNRDIRPILSENCFYCHGQDPKHREADLRLDLPEDAMRATNGVAAIVPGKPEKSEIIIRLLSKDADEVMPPPKAHKLVTPEQVSLLERWIAEGAKYETHWAFIPPQKVQLPEVKAADWARDELDRFVLAKLEREGLNPARQATAAAWLRRASFDLTGLAPSPLELDAFDTDVKAKGESAYEAAVDRLLGSPRFGERLAQDWLDAARYADTHGFNNDTGRSMWRWRDWVIDAFNANKPYDEFLVEQFAGDLLPQPSLDQRIATGFGRNHVINSEGGIIDEEYRVEYVVDRVRTLGMSTLGLTLECARCHDHKFDPITQKNYYEFYAFFNQVQELGEDGRVANAAPFIQAPTKEQQAKFGLLDQGIASKTLEIERILSEDRAVHDDDRVGHRLKEIITGEEFTAPQAASLLLEGRAGLDGKTELFNRLDPQSKAVGVATVIPADHSELGSVLRFDGQAGATLADNPVKADKPWSLLTWVRWSGGEAAICSTMDMRESMTSVNYGKGVAIRVTEAGRVEVRFSMRWPSYAAQVITEEKISSDRWQHLAVVFDGSGTAAGIRVFIDGIECAKEVRHDGMRTSAKGFSAGGGKFQIGDEAAPEPLRFRGELAGFSLYPISLEPDQFRPWVETSLARVLSSEMSRDRSEWLRGQLLRRTNPSYSALVDEVLALRDERRLLYREVPSTMVMAELPAPRVTHLLERGMYDAPGEVVQPGVPENLLGKWPADAPRNRLGLARWLTQAENPLTARVAVNRFWQQLFGVGIVKTSDDFGFQGEYPAHLHLLDHLALDFIASGWNTKGMLRRLVLSSTYRQDSAISPELLERDPENRLLARGPRVRLSAEEIRDHALAVGGLLRQRLGGPSVFPAQPEGLYKGIVVDSNYPGTSWTDSTGDDLYRRSIYTYWKRTVPYPVLNVFDAPDREFCAVRRSRTNTPLQALTMMNEPSMVDAGRRLGGRMIREGGADDRSRLGFGFRAVTGRLPSDEEHVVLLETLDHFRKDFTEDGEGAKALLGTTSPDPELAAYAALGGLLLNLDEAVTKN